MTILLVFYLFNLYYLVMKTGLKNKEINISKRLEIVLTQLERVTIFDKNYPRKAASPTQKKKNF